jgi:hypothetical protein
MLELRRSGGTEEAVPADSDKEVPRRRFDKGDGEVIVVLVNGHAINAECVIEREVEEGNFLGKEVWRSMQSAMWILDSPVRSRRDRRDQLSLFWHFLDRRRSFPTGPFS